MKNNLRTLRAEKNWSQDELARKLHVSRQTINAIETERYDPSLPLAFRIARLFHRPIEEIFQDGLHEYLVTCLEDFADLGTRMQRAYLGAS